MLFMPSVFMLSSLFIAALWSPSGKGLTSWLLFVMLNCVYAIFHVVSWVMYGTRLYRFLIFGALLIPLYLYLTNKSNYLFGI